MYELTSPRFADPIWFNQVRQGISEATVVDSRSVEVSGIVLYLTRQDEISLSSGQRVFVVLRDRFYLETEEECSVRKLEIEQEHRREDEERRSELNKKREEADSFHARMRIPVPWTTGYKPVLSGLSEMSYGNGRNAATVVHILLQSNLDDGRLHRLNGDFLCSTAQGKNGKRWVSPESAAFDGEGNRYRAKVTCGMCLRYVQRWIRPG